MPDTSYIETLKVKRQRAGLAKALGSSKQSVILTAQADLGKKVDAFSDKVVATLGKLDTTVLQKRHLTLLAGLVKEVKTLQTAIDRQTVQLVRAINKIELSPQITVPTPVVTDTGSGNRASDKKGINLNDYRAHDLDDAPDGKQYIGFISMDGKWYIVQSDDASNSMRYYFSDGDYDTEWMERYSHEYKTLSEAIRGLAA